MSRCPIHHASNKEHFRRFYRSGFGLNTLAGVVLALTLACLCPANALGNWATTETNLLEKFVEALNSKSGNGLEPFLKQYASGAVPVADRLVRAKGLAAQGAPFKIVKMIPGKPDELNALVTDKNGVELGFRMKLAGTTDPKMDGVMVVPSERLNTAPPKNHDDWKSLESLAEAIRTDAKSPAMGIAVLIDGKLEQAVAGIREQASDKLVTAEEPWSVGSIGKPICTTVIGRLIEMDKLKWDTTLSQALPNIPMKEGYKNVTLEQLMQHRGGIPGEPGMQKQTVDRIVAGATDPIKIRQSYAKDILQREPIGKPGERFAYSNAGYALLGVIAEEVSGKPYERLVRELVFDPLGLKHSFTNLDKLPEERPSGHMNGPNGLQASNFSGPIEVLFAPAGGGMYMSLGDLIRFAESHLRGLQGQDGLLKAATIQRLHQGVPEARADGREYACGWGLEAFPGLETMHTHNGSNGTMISQVAIFPKAKMVIASFVNAGGESEPAPPLQAILAIAKRYSNKK